VDAGDVDIPTLTADDLLRDLPVLVLAPHPDDESLACGGLLAAAFSTSCPGAHVVCLTNGGASHPGSRKFSQSDVAAIRRRELVSAVELLGGHEADVTWIGAPDGALVASDDIVRAVTAQARGSGLLLAPSPLDPHCDHVAGAEIGRLVARALPGLRLVFYPVWSRWHGGGAAPVLQGTRATRFETGPFRARKQAAIAAHLSQQGALIDDDPDGFEMPPGFAAFFGSREEVYLVAADGGLA
jgi:LmbE family N-acetylglucosaminyl deacetylase